MNFFQPIEVLASRPEEIEISRVEMTEAGLFFYQGQQLILYIKDTDKKIKVLEQNPEQANKFHLANCTTIGSTLHNYRIFQRFIATARDDGFFYVNGLTEDGKSKECLLKLKVCRSCLIKLNYKEYRASDPLTRDGLVETFSIQDFFASCVQENQLTIPASSTYKVEVNILLVQIYFVHILLKQIRRYLFNL